MTKEGTMRSCIALSVVGVALACVTAALAHNTPWSWSPGRAAQIVVADVTVHLPAAERTAVEAEIRSARSQYALAEMIAYEEGDWLAQGMYHNLVTRLTKALDKVQRGFGIDTARCTGIGRAVKGRFKHFRCSITSQSAEIPTVASVERNGDKQIVVEGPPRLVGPIEVQLQVHVKGKSTISYRPL
jgi:hypothetical protein